MLEKKLKNEIITELENLNKDNILISEEKVLKLFSVLKLKYGIKEVSEPINSRDERYSKTERVRRITINQDEEYLLNTYGLSNKELVAHAYNYEYVFNPKRIGGILNTFRSDFEMYIPEQIIRELKLKNGTIVKLVNTEKIAHTKAFYTKSDFEVIEYKDIPNLNSLKSFNFGWVQEEIVSGRSKLYVETDIFYNPLTIKGKEVKLYLEKHDISTLRIRNNDIVDLSWYEDTSSPNVAVKWKFAKKFRDAVENLEYVRYELYSGLDFPSTAPEFSIENISFENYQNYQEIDNKSLIDMKDKINKGFTIRSKQDTNTVWNTSGNGSQIPLTLIGKKIVLLGSMNKNTSLENMLTSRGAKVSILTDSKIKGQNDIIRNSDLIVFYTNRISHSDYNRMKSVADMNGVKVLHFNKTNNEELLKLIYSEFNINSSI